MNQAQHTPKDPQQEQGQATYSISPRNIKGKGQKKARKKITAKIDK